MELDWTCAQKGEDCMVAMAWQPEEIRKPERPKITWRRTSEKGRSQDGWPSWAEIRGTRAKWKTRLAAFCASWRGGNYVPSKCLSVEFY